MKWSGNNNYSTPAYLYQALDMEFAFDLDPCPLNPDFDPEKDQDGLKLDWDGRRVFVNPPWSDIEPWVRKAYQSKALTVFVVPARTDTQWFHILLNSGAELRYFRKAGALLAGRRKCQPHGRNFDRDCEKDEY